MSTLPTFTFGMYKLRPATAEDFPLAAVWTRADEDHRNMDPLFWVDGRDSYLLMDVEGPVFFFKIERARNREAKFYIQFAPCATAECRQRTMDGLTDGSAWLEKELGGLGFETVYFTSKRRTLILFCTKRLGYSVDGNVLRKDIRRLGDGGQVDPKSGQEDGSQGYQGELRQSDGKEDCRRQA